MKSITDITNISNASKYILDNLARQSGSILIFKADWDKEELVYANKSLIKLLGYEDETDFLELTGNSFKGIAYSEDYDTVRNNLHMRLSSSDELFVQKNFRMSTKGGKPVYVVCHCNYLDAAGEGETPVVLMFVNQYRYSTESLTGLTRRRSFFNLANDYAAELLEKNMTPVIIALNLIAMKRFNKRYGMEEGDKLLISFAQLLVKCFGLKHCSRFGEDHFYVYTDKESLQDKLDSIINELKELNDGKTLSVRMGLSLYGDDVSAETACDNAKVAADTLSSAVNSTYVWYDNDIEHSISKKNYILTNIDRAVSEGWIEPFYQPVIRTYTEQICGYEALARWIDPEHGFLSPGDFIPILEDNGFSYKLDMYIARRAITMLQQRQKTGLPTVPVSVNISRSDFDYCDPVEIISNECDIHGVGRNLICIEITETAIMTDREQIREAISKFHAAGFEVYMDDFGSGYSSLNILKDFDFDEIKIDMGFLRNFNEKSKTIVTMAVKMAKNLGMHTLAEGVETKEHADFLRDIGCERIQGYYYGKPMPYGEAEKFREEKGMLMETRELYSLYQKAGMIDVVSSLPLALYFYDGQDFSVVYKNTAYIEHVADISFTSTGTIDKGTSLSKDTIYHIFQNLADKVISSGKMDMTTFVYNGRYFLLSFEAVAASREGHILSATISSEIYEKLEEANQSDRDLRNLAAMYDNVYVLDMTNDSVNVLTSNIVGESMGQRYDSLNMLKELSVKLNVYTDDLEKWHQFSEKDYLLSRIKKSDRGFFSEIFLVKNSDGNYSWIETLVEKISDSQCEKLLLCIKPAYIDQLDSQEKKDYVRRILDYGYLKLNDNDDFNSDIWASFINEGNLKLFWKDTNRRFLGASKAFYNYYGFRSKEDIIGKTDEELGWHLNDTPFESDEHELLSKGYAIYNKSTINIINGRSHNIVASKIPIYHDNKIVGLVGYFVDADEDIIADGASRDDRSLDPVTGVMNTLGLQAAIYELENNYKTNGEEYCYTSIFVEGYNAVLHDYGETVAHKLLVKLSDTIKAAFGKTAVISRNEGSAFGICEKGLTISEVLDRVANCVTQINKITEIDGRSCRLVAHYGTTSSSEKDAFENIVELTNQKLHTGQKGRDSNARMKMEIVPDPYSDIPFPGFMATPKYTEGSTEPTDIIYIFVNKAYCELTGKTREQLLGKGYYEIFPNTDKKCLSLISRAARGEYIRAKIYDGASYQWMNITASPTDIPNTCFVHCEVVNK